MVARADPKAPPRAYSFFQDIDPRPPLEAQFDRDYLLYAVSGALRVEVAGQSWLLPSSFAAWVPAGTGLRVSLLHPVTTCSILTDPGFAPGFGTAPCAFQMSTLARHMIRHCSPWGQEAKHPPEAETFFRALLDLCAGLARQSTEIARPRGESAPVNAAIDLTEARLTEPLTATGIARDTGQSERSMQRRFLAETGRTWSATLTRLRMIRAVELLSLDELSILQIAGACGYGSLSAFNRAFRSYAGTTPSAFRARLSHTGGV